MTGAEHAATFADLRLRQLTAGDAGAIEAHLLGLDMMSRNSRFHCALGDYAVAQYARCFDAAVDTLFGAVDARSGCIVALAEARRADVSYSVDLAVSVHPSHRRRGLGRSLAARAVAAAFARGATEARLRFAPANPAAARIAAGLGAKFCAPGLAILLA